MESQSVPPSNKLRRYPHNLRLLLGVRIPGVVAGAILVIIACVAVDRYVQAQFGAAHLESLGARVQFGKSDVTVVVPGDRDIAVLLKEAASDLRHVSRCYPMNLNLSQSRVSDADLEQLGMIQHLFSLNLAGTEITDRSLEQLEGSKSLFWLDLTGTKVTDAGLTHLKGVTQLVQLSLAHTSITDEGLEHLKGLGQLYSLDVNNTKITDAGLKKLKRLAGLRHLDVRGTRVTAEGVARFQWANLECGIER